MITVHKKVLDEIRAGNNECSIEVTRLNGEVRSVRSPFKNACQCIMVRGDDIIWVPMLPFA